ncbi:MAG: 7-carboxy-7-deazaguanine synthase [Candidatus Methanofastidiosum methylothiophilum]|uniref:7-carboxy-7-deazaguanine synthase n=1 Tax=Candidatus Methanofastidiosum methylothiophilum TaxID=1705564 RepID=A0A150INE7_9EURY|nr:MAG: 7-carboxy-7-deazaguanine synthase [Candidatus Methanofastidiosum methylthiophilus]KYC48420.1 MAG: 7-carboxy-7-deazaguanine synthase [Candidatus Methanofastidiosum methylthiophilus]KYC51068.1 MAG: 7-carboxy-7-deazaguanine synthase [Candidatus Methanofastidiosum methylthiophilus]
MPIKKTDANSIYTGKLPEGCKLCIKGRKSVLFVTGICHVNCYYCPVSNEKKGKDVSYINERKLEKKEDVLEEIKACDSKGISFTGGDPLLKIEKCLEYAKLIKEDDSKHHIHLYTGSTDKTSTGLKKLEGYVDEVRFHVKSQKEIETLKSVLDMDFNFGIEIPAIPGDFDRISSIIQSASSVGFSFINLNEFEYTETNWDNLSGKGFNFDTDTSMVKGSKVLSIELIEKYQDLPISLHFCPSVLKDAIQLRRRWERRAKNTKKYYEEIDDCLIVKGELSGNVEDITKYLTEELNISKKMYEVHGDKVFTHWAIAEDISENKKVSKKIKTAIVKEYPIYKRLVVEYIPL